jgi:ribosome maturation factor RimP
VGGLFQPIFFAWVGDEVLGSGISSINWQVSIERTVGALGYDVVDIERAAGGLLRVFIDRRPGQAYPSAPGAAVTIEDCEQVTRQLQYALEVDGVRYERLEVSSPGLDRPLKREADFERFAGQEVSLTLKRAFQGRRAYRGVLRHAEAGAQGWGLVFKEGNQEQMLAFALDEVREARLVPVLDFKGRRARPLPSAGGAEVNGGQGR